MTIEMLSKLSQSHIPAAPPVAGLRFRAIDEAPPVANPGVQPNRPDWQAGHPNPWSSWLSEFVPSFGSLLTPIWGGPNLPRFFPISPVGSPPANPQLGTEGADSMTGDSTDDALRGMAGADTLLGAGGNDWLSGDYGNDILDGGQGNDVLLGGKGYDRYEFTTADWQAQPGSKDVIYDSDGQGQIIIDGKALTLGQKLSDGVWASADGLFTITLSGRSLAGQSVVIEHVETGSQIQVLDWRFGDFGLDVGRFGKFPGGFPITAPIVGPGYPDDPMRPVMGMAGIQMGYGTRWNEGHSNGMRENSFLLSQWDGKTAVDSTLQNILPFKNHAQVDLLIEAMGGFSTSSTMALGNVIGPSNNLLYSPLVTSIE